MLIPTAFCVGETFKATRIKLRGNVRARLCLRPSRARKIEQIARTVLLCAKTRMKLPEQP